MSIPILHLRRREKRRPIREKARKTRGGGALFLTLCLNRDFEGRGGGKKGQKKEENFSIKREAAVLFPLFKRKTQGGKELTSLDEEMFLFSERRRKGGGGFLGFFFKGWVGCFFLGRVFFFFGAVLGGEGTASPPLGSTVSPAVLRGGKATKKKKGQKKTAAPSLPLNGK